jgi:hypothetical protein
MVIDKIGIWLKRLLIIGILGGIIIFICSGVIANIITPDDPPDIHDASWAVQATKLDPYGEPIGTQIFYAKQFRLNEKTPEIRGYWTFDGMRYNYTADIKSLDTDRWTNVKAVKRTE